MYEEPAIKKRGYRGGKRAGQTGIERSISACGERVAEASVIGWPALEQSWQRDMDKLRDLKANGQTATMPELFDLQKRCKNGGA